MASAARICAVILLCLSGAGVRAADGDPCAGAAWPLDAELAWFRAGALETLQSGAKLAAAPQKAISLALRPSASVALPAAPSGKPRGASGETFAGFATLEAVPEGLYQVTLSTRAWVDVVQDGVALPDQGHTGLHDCPVIRKSVRFRLAAGPAILQFSSAPGATVGFAIRRVE